MKAPSTSSNANVGLKGEVAVVSGASQGIGLAVALRFARAGADVWAVARSEPKGKDVVEQLKQAGAIDARCFLADLSRKDDVLRVADEIKAAAGEKGVEYLIQTQ
ncbi:NAD(P)-binding protein, partial [Auricularia subglabra TFB-10046 SS5]